MDEEIQQIIITERDEHGFDDIEINSEMMSIEESTSTSFSDELNQNHIQDQYQRRCQSKKSIFFVEKSKNVSASQGRIGVKVSSKNALLDGKFFSVVSENTIMNKYRRKIRKIKAKCMLCPRKQASLITCSYDSMSNFLRHIKRKHGENAYDAYVAYKRCKGLNLDRQTQRLTNLPELSPLPRILEPQSQDKVQKLIDRFQVKLLKFMINCMQPLSLLDNASFKDLFPEVLTPLVKSFVVGPKLIDYVDHCRETLVNILRDVKYLCLTIDIWTERMTSYIGFTSHWMNDVFEKNSAVMACSRVMDSSSISVSNCLKEIFSSYNLKEEQITVVITNNGCCYARALIDFGISNYKFVHSNHFQLKTNNPLQKEKSIARISGVVFEDLKVDELSHFMFNNLPNVCHVLNYVALNDFTSLLTKYDIISTLHECTVSKCDILWSPQANETVTKIVGQDLPIPFATNWISLYRALRSIYNIKLKLPEICQEMKIEEFLSEEIDYLEIYINVMNPLAAAIDTLEGDNVYFGFVLPTLLTVKMKLEEICKFDDTIGSIIAQFILEKFLERFQSFLELNTDESCVRQAIFAAVSHPKLKLRWISNNNTLSEIKQLLIDECVALDTEKESAIEDVDDDEFFSVCLKSDSGNSAKNEIKSSIELEVLRFLASKDKSMDMLHSYPNVKSVFLKYNSLVTSQLPVNKLFSFESLINRESLAEPEELRNYMFLKGNISFIT